MAKAAQSNVERYKQLCREVSKQLGVKPDDPRVPHVASLHLGRESLMAQLIAGQDDVDPTALLRFDEALRQYMPATAPIQISLSPMMHCPKCHAPLVKQASALSATAIEPAKGVVSPHADLPAPVSPATSVEAIPPKPKAKPKPAPEPVFIKDTRPNAPAAMNGGSVVWFGGPGK
jgi:hypothetical protein